MPATAEIRKMSSDMLSAERAGAKGIYETTPPWISPAVAAFCTTLSSETPVFIPVLSDNHGLFGWCSDGVDDKVTDDGGHRKFGWTIWEWPGVMLTAEFHCVWESPAGDLQDITPKPARENRIIFVPDSSYPDSFDFDKRPGNHRRRIYQPADPGELLAREVGRLKPSQRAYEIKRADKMGMSLEEWLSRKIPTDSLPAAIDRVITATNAHEDYFDSLGASGVIKVDPQLARLLRERIAAIEDLKRAIQQSRGKGR